MTDADNQLCALYVDAGTTNTRVWLAEDEQVLSRVTAQVGVRDTARDGSPHKLRFALRDLIADARAHAGAVRLCAPSHVIAAGMISSPLGLAKVTHIAAPAGRAELAAGVAAHQFPDITELPFLLVPGVRCGPLRTEASNIGEVDLMRGEETLCLGLSDGGLLGANATLLNLGSHWKTIKLDEAGRIASSVTRLSGEMIHAVQEHTILASAVTRERPVALSEEWLAAGMREQRRRIKARLSACVCWSRRRTAPDDRLSYLIGAFVASALDSLVAAETFTPNSPSSSRAEQASPPPGLMP
ncbi:MAG: 2-dehydro-3-deoxygalactonokinase [Pyrinomonadaceae bacterium]